MQGYVVADFGSTVTLNLVYDYVGRPRMLSNIRFSQVVLYHFEHPTGAIITGNGDFHTYRHNGQSYSHSATGERFSRR
jgi:hypothetical protein